MKYIINIYILTRPIKAPETLLTLKNARCLVWLDIALLLVKPGSF